MVPRIFGPYEPIRRDYPIEEYLADIAGTGVEKSVYVQANWAPERAEDEVAWVQKTADETGWPHAIVGYADLMADDVRPALDRLKKLSAAARHPHAASLARRTSSTASPSGPTSPTIRLSAGILRRSPTTAFPSTCRCSPDQMEGAARLAADFPQTTFILQHAGMLEDLSEAGRAAWRDGMRRARGAAERRLKALRRSARSFIATIRRTSPGSCGETVALFGADRCLFGSNFPIEKMWTDYRAR